MQVYDHYLPELTGSLADLDLHPSGGWIGVTTSGPRQHLYVGLHPVAMPKPCTFPCVRAVGDDRILLVDRRTPRHRDNAWIIDSMGNVEAHFHLGDAINDVVVFAQCLAVTYFDEAARSAEGLSGVVLFDFAGRVLFRQTDVHWMLDCYCACPLTQERLLFLAYPGFPIVLLDTRTQREQEWDAPRALHGARAVTVAGATAFFHSPYSDRSGIYRWRFGAPEVVRVADYGEPLRGLRGGEFVAIREAGYTLLSLVDDL